MSPLIKEFQKNEQSFQTRVCVTAQHREMLDQVLEFFEINPEYDLNLMKANQSLHSLTAEIILGLESIFKDYQPDYVFVHGDTTTSTAAALAAFYAGIKVCHIEAGLRTNNKWSPFPEEVNRQITGRIADLHFAPTQASKANLIKENIVEANIFVTGNTVIDALLYSKDRVSNIDNLEIENLKSIINPKQKVILVTGHRRENFGQGFINICHALRRIAQNFNDFQIIYPLHLNPNVSEPVKEILGDVPNVHLIAPLAYPAFVWLMNKCFLIITDSGGVQEEAPSLGKPVLVMRETTERPEAVDAGTVILVGTNDDKIYDECSRLIKNEANYNRMAHIHNPYGDGTAAKVIAEQLLAVNNKNYK